MKKELFITAVQSQKFNDKYNKFYISKLRFLVFLAVLLSIFNHNSLAQKEESAKRGSQIGAAYSISDIETINNTNGNIIYNIPLASLPSGRAGLNHGVSLTYNSKMYDVLTEMFAPIPGNSNTVTNLKKSDNGGWRYGVEYKFEQKQRPGSSISPHDACASINDIDFKKVNIYKYVITFPDGSSREFKPSNYYVNGMTTSDTNDNYYPLNISGIHRRVKHNFSASGSYLGCDIQLMPYSGTLKFHSTDGSNLRLEIAADGDSDPNNNFWVLKMPNGTRITGNESVNGTVVYQRIYDQNDNYIEIDKQNPNANTEIINVSDQLGRNIQINQNLQTLQDTITQTGFNGAQISWTVKWKNIYVLRNYKQDTIENQNQFGSAQLQYDFKVVDEIILPTQLGALKYEFEYNGKNSSSTIHSEGFGEVEQIKLPTGATVDYEYELDNTQSTIPSWQTVMHNPLTKKTLSYQANYDGIINNLTDIWNYNITRTGSTITGPDGSISTATYSDIYAGGDGIVSETSNSVSIKRQKYISSSDTSWQKLVEKDWTIIKDINGNPSKTAFREYAYDYNGNLLRIKEYDWIAYSTAHMGTNPTIPSNAPLKRITENTYYNATPEITGSTNPGHTNSYTNENSPKIINLPKSSEVKNPNGTPVSRIEYSYDNNASNPLKGNLTETKMWDSTKGAYSSSLTTSNSIKTTATYDSYGNPTIVYDAKNYQTRFTYGAINGHSGLYPTQTETAYGTTVERTSTAQYDFYTGLVTSSTDVDNNVTSVNEYDDLGRPTKIKAAVGTINEIWTTTEYNDALRRVVTKSDLNVKGDGKVVSIKHYDQLGRIRLARALEDSVTQSPYNETQGIKVQTRYRTTNPYTYAVTSNPYRAATSAGAGSEQGMGWTRSKGWNHGRLSENETFSGAGLPAPWGSNSSTTGKVITEIDAEATTVTDQAGKKRRSITNGLGQLTRVDEPNASGSLGTKTSPVQPTSYTYDVLGNLVEVTQGVQKRYFGYDSLGTLIRVRQPEQQINTTLNLSVNGTSNSQWTSGFTYDDNGNLLTSTDAKNIVITRTYDPLDRIVTKSYSDGTPTVTNTYDNKPNAKGLLTKVSNSISTTEFTLFDKMGRSLSSQQITDGQTYTSSYQYNLAGLLTQHTYPTGRVITNTYDNKGDLNQINGQKNGVNKMYANSFTYTPSGHIEKLKLGNNLWEAAKFNSRLQVTEIGLGISATNLNLWKTNLEYGELNTNGTVNTTKNTGNIAKQTVSFSGLSQPFVQTYKYDSLHRLTEAKEMSGSSQNWKQTFNYDRYGNRTTFTQIVGTNNLPINNHTKPNIDVNTNRFSAGQGYTYDFNGNLISDPEGRQYTFNGENKQTEVKNAQNQVIGSYYYDGSGKRIKKVTATETTIFVYSGSKLVAEYSTTTPLTQATTKYLATDTLGSVRAISDQNGNVVSRRDFMPFGEELYAGTPNRTTSQKYSPGGDNVRQKFTGYERDHETGLDFAEARYYKNNHGRFTAVDPLLASGKSINPQTFNRYTYVMNSPLAYTDSNGLQAGKVAGKVTGGIKISSPCKMGTPGCSPVLLAEIEIDGGSDSLDMFLIETTSQISQSITYQSLEYASTTVTSAIVTFAENNFSEQIVGPVDVEHNNLGRAIGHTASIIQGVSEIAAGISIGTAGGAEAVVTSPACATGAGCALPAVGVGAAAAGTVITTHGAGVLANTAYNIYNQASGNNESSSPTTVTHNGHPTNARGRKLGPSGKPMIHQTNHSTKKRAKDAARKDGNRAPMQHKSPKRGGPHFHARKKVGKKKPRKVDDGNHHNYPNN